jgi:hypothetical protein
VTVHHRKYCSAAAAAVGYIWACNSRFLMRKQKSLAINFFSFFFFVSGARPRLSPKSTHIKPNEGRERNNNLMNGYRPTRFFFFFFSVTYEGGK